MESLITDFHIDFKLYLAQIVNFGIVFMVLYFFAFKPLIKNMASRSEKIEQSLKEAEEINQKMLETDLEKERIILEAKKQANEIIDHASKLGEEKRTALLIKAKEEIGQIINTEKEKLVRDKESILKDIKREVAEMVVLTTKKVISGNMNESLNNDIIKDSLK